MSFKYKLSPRPPKQNLNRIAGHGDEIVLSGFVRGQQASDNEEKFAKAMAGENREYIFQYYIPTRFQIPGQANSVDFMDTTEVWTPIEIDDNYTHKSGAQRAEDQMRDQILNQEFAEEGINPIVRIPVTGEETVEDFMRIIREIF
jgi:hypothetical protein